jgi:glycosyltransferase involved in cell wall biosynthesis
MAIMSVGPDISIPRMSVVIPAHNEERLIERCLRSVLAATSHDAPEIVVIVNGSTDRTAEIAASISDAVRVVELAKGSKVLALNEGDRVATAFPRFYVDADTALSVGALDALCREMAERRLPAAAPAIRFGVDGASLLCRAYYRVWSQAPYFGDGLLGSGFVGLSREGRERFDEWPDVHADDEFARRLFNFDEIGCVREHTFTPLFPTTVRSLVRVQVRHFASRFVLVNDHGEAGAAPQAAWVARLARRPGQWPDLAVFVTLNAVALIAAKRRSRHRAPVWLRDGSTR